MFGKVSVVVILAACLSFTAIAQDYSVIDPAQFPGKVRFMQLAQAKFDKGHKALFQTSPVKPEDEQAVFECMMKAVLADMPDDVAMRAADTMEGKAAPDAEIKKWFNFNRRNSPDRYKQVVSRAADICPKFGNLLQ